MLLLVTSLQLHLLINSHAIELDNVGMGTLFMAACAMNKVHSVPQDAKT